MAIRQMDIRANNQPGASTIESVELRTSATVAISGTTPGQELLIQWDDATPASEILEAYRVIMEEIEKSGVYRTRPGVAAVVAICVP